MAKKKVFNVDEYLQEAGIDIILNNKTYTITDIPFELREQMAAPDADSREILQKLLGCEQKDLKDIGIATAVKILNTINEALFPPTSQKPLSSD